MKRWSVTPQTAKRVKAIAAAALALTLAVPATTYFSAKSSRAEAEESGPQAVTTVTFDKGFKAEKAAHGLNVVKSEEMVMFKEYYKEGTEKDFVYDENNSKIYDVTDIPFIEADQYKYGVKGNQPSTAYDEDMGTVLIFDDTVFEPEFKKQKEDAMKDVEIGKVLQYETVAQSQVQINNPFADKDLSNGASVSYWVKVPADKDDKSKGANSSLVVFGIKDEDNRKVKTTENGLEKQQEKEAEAKLSVQISANNDFHYVSVDNDKSVAYEGDGTVTAKPNTWAYVTVSMTDSKIVTYVNGVETSSKDVDAAGLTASLADAGTGVFFGGNYSTAAASVQQDFGTVKGVCMDNIAFYTQAVTAEEAAQLYNAANTEKYGNTNPYLSEAVVLEKFDFENGMTGTNGTVISGVESNPAANAPSVVTDAERGNVLKVTDGSASKSAGAILSQNPFKGQDLLGATVNYWVKEAKNPKTGINPTVSMAFIDTPKLIDHPKLQESYKKEPTSTVLYTRTDLDSWFCEGYTTGAYDSMKNIYKFSVKKNTHVKDEKDAAGNLIDPFYDEEAVAKQAEYTEKLTSMESWHMVTAVFTNAGVRMYYDGKEVNNNLANADDKMLDENGKLVGRPDTFGPRFYDGYYQMMYDGYAPFHRSSDNQGATPLLSFLTDETTNAYVGFMYKQGSNNVFERTYEAYYDDIQYFASALTASQVDELFNGPRPTPAPVVSEEPQPTQPVTPPDPDKGGQVVVPVTKDEQGNMIGESSGVRVEIPAGVLPDNTELKLGMIGRQADTASYDNFNTVLAGKDFTIKDFVIYTITASDATVTPNGTFKMSFAIPDGYDTNALVVVDESGKEYAVTVSADGKLATIEGVDHFGKFALIMKDMSTDDESVIAGKNAYGGKFGDSANLALLFSIAGVSCAAIVVTIRLKKRKEEEA